MGDHSKVCTFNPAVQHRRCQEEANEVVEAEAEERRRQTEAQEAETIAARRQDTCNCHPDDWCTCGAARIAEEDLQLAACATTIRDTTSAPLYLCNELNRDEDTLKEVWSRFKEANSKRVLEPDARGPEAPGPGSGGTRPTLQAPKPGSMPAWSPLRRPLCPRPS